WLELSVNGGYRLDNSQKIFDGEIDRAQRFPARVAQVNALLAGLGVGFRYEVGTFFTVQPFVEIHGEIGPDTAYFRHNPIRAAGAVRVVPSGSAVELTAGADVRISGAPQEGNPF